MRAATGQVVALFSRSRLKALQAGAFGAPKQQTRRSLSVSASLLGHQNEKNNKGSLWWWLRFPRVIKPEWSRLKLAHMEQTSEKGNQKQENPVSLDKEAREFRLELGANQVARIQYNRLHGDNVIDMYHTEVPVQMRGRGFGGLLARGSLQRAASEGMRVKLSCSYLVHYLNKNGDPNAGIVIGLPVQKESGDRRRD